MHCLKLGVCKNKRHQSTRVCHLRTRIINPTRPDSVLTAYWNILAVLESFMSVYKTKTQAADNEHSGFHPMTHPQHVQTCKHTQTLIQMNADALSLTLNTGVTVRNAAQLVRPDEKSSTAARLLSTTRDAVSKKFGSGVILRAKISNISTAMFLFIAFPFATEYKNTTLRSNKPCRAF